MPSPVKKGFYKRKGGAWKKVKGSWRKVGSGKGTHSRRAVSSDKKRRAKISNKAKRYPQAYDAPTHRTKTRKSGTKKTKQYKLVLPWHKYKGDGKTWVAVVDENDKIKGFVRYTDSTATNGTKRGAYAGERIYYLDDGLYMSHEPSTKKYSVRTVFEIKNGRKREIKGRSFPDYRGVGWHYIRQ